MTSQHKTDGDIDFSNPTNSVVNWSTNDDHNHIEQPSQVKENLLQHLAIVNFCSV